MVDLILDLKRWNPLFGTKRLRDELKKLGIIIGRETIRLILLENAYTTPALKFHPPTWQALIKSSFTWGLDFTCVIDFGLFQLFILGVIDHKDRTLKWVNVTVNPTESGSYNSLEIWQLKK